MIANEIIKAALLGTDKYMPGPIAAIEETQARITAQPTSQEDRFLKVAATALLYEEAGTMPQDIDITLPLCPDETAPLMEPKTARLLSVALHNKEEVVFQYIMYRSHSRGQVAPSEMVPTLLNKALDQKKNLQPIIVTCGETGKWLCSLNSNWGALLAENVEEDVWGSGSHEARKAWLTELRKTDPAEALKLLTETFDKENAANRLSFMDVLEEGLSLDDEPFLTSLAQDKSQKVKDGAIFLLRRLSGSAINNSYLRFLAQAIEIKEERYMLISKKTVLHINDYVIPEEDIYKSGIERVSADKNVSDNMYVIGQVLANVNMSVLARRLNVFSEELMNLLLQHKDVAPLLPYLASSATFFKNKPWAIALLKQIPRIQLLDVLTEAERQHYYPQFVDSDFPALLQYVLNPTYNIISTTLADKMLGWLSKNPYAITAPQYQRLALHMPQDMVGKIMLMKEEPGGDYQARYFKTQLVEMMRIMELKNMVQ